MVVGRAHKKKTDPLYNMKVLNQKTLSQTVVLYLLLLKKKRCNFFMAGKSVNYFELLIEIIKLILLYFPSKSLKKFSNSIKKIS